MHCGTAITEVKLGAKFLEVWALFSNLFYAKIKKPCNICKSCKNKIRAASERNKTNKTKRTSFKCLQTFISVRHFDQSRLKIPFKPGQDIVTNFHTNM